MPQWCFERTGCLITADGSDDRKIKLEGLPNYSKPHMTSQTNATYPYSICRELTAPAVLYKYIAKKLFLCMTTPEEK